MSKKKKSDAARKTATGGQKQIFDRLLNFESEMVPNDLHSGGDINGQRIHELLGELDVDSLKDTEDGSGEYIIGVLTERGIRTYHWGYDRDIRNREEALSWFKKAQEKGYPAAIKRMEEIAKADEAKNAHESELERLRKKADSGDAEAAAEYGFTIWNEKIKDRYQPAAVYLDTALEYLTKAGEAGVIPAQMHLGKYYEREWKPKVWSESQPREYKPENYGKAKYWYEKSAAAGNAEVIEKLNAIRIEHDGPAIFETIFFGGYKWLLLDKQEDKALILLAEIQEMRAFHTRFGSAKWETCTLRKYLNNKFYQSFTADEQARILETKIDNPPNLEQARILALEMKTGNPPDLIQKAPGEDDTLDNVFLLSLDEIDKYFNYSGSYYTETGWHRFSKVYDNARAANEIWWLRSPGGYDRSVAVIDSDGSVDASGDYLRYVSGVRPAMWIKL